MKYLIGYLDKETMKKLLLALWCSSLFGMEQIEDMPPLDPPMLLFNLFTIEDTDDNRYTRSWEWEDCEDNIDVIERIYRTPIQFTTDAYHRLEREYASETIDELRFERYLKAMQEITMKLEALWAARNVEVMKYRVKQEAVKHKLIAILGKLAIKRCASAITMTHNMSVLTRYPECDVTNRALHILNKEYLEEKAAQREGI